jgi:hypothetical protein
VGERREGRKRGATLFWDEVNGSIGMKFPLNGKVMRELKRRKVKYFFSDED